MTATSAAAAEHATTATAISNASGNEIMAIDVGEKEIGIQDATGASLGTQPRKRRAPLSPPVTLSGLGQTQSQKRKAPLSPPVTVSDFDQQSVVIPEEHTLQIWNDLFATNLFALHALKKGNPQSAVEAKAKEILFRQAQAEPSVGQSGPRPPLVM